MIVGNDYIICAVVSVRHKKAEIYEWKILILITDILTFNLETVMYNNSYWRYK